MMSFARMCMKGSILCRLREIEHDCSWLLVISEDWFGRAVCTTRR